MTASHEEHDSSHPTFKQYVWIAIFLFAVTIVEFLLIYDKVGIDDDLGASKIPILIFLSAMKFAVVIMYYMHLKFDNRLFSGIFLAGLALAFAVGVALIGLFVTFGGEPREFAEAHAVPYSEEGHEPGGGESEQHADEGAALAGQETAVVVSEESSAAEAVEPADTGVAEIHILQVGAAGDALEFDKASFTASAGSEVVLTFTNGSTINQHNWVLVQTGTKDAVAADGAVAGPANDWIPPDDPRVLFHTKLLNPGEVEEIRFTPDSGDYRFVCTFPGHSPTMFGDFEVTP